MSTCHPLEASPLAWQPGFLQLLPAIRRIARIRLRHLAAEAREEAVSDVVAQACLAYRRLHERGQLDRAFATPLATFAAAQYRVGRRVGARVAGRDVCSPHAQRRARFTLTTAGDDAAWRDAIVDNRRTPVPDQVAFRLDFPAWLRRLSPRNRRLVRRLAQGDTTSEAAAAFAVSPGRVSQLRRELAASWAEFLQERRPGAVA
jgi:hypothetical protein